VSIEEEELEICDYIKIIHWTKATPKIGCDLGQISFLTKVHDHRGTQQLRECGLTGEGENMCEVFFLCNS
jgi:hypothetical protein